MTPQLQNILDLIKQSAQITDADKAAIEKAIKETDKALEIANFKLDRTEKVKRTTAILLEETIQELELKRKAVEDQNRELEIESSLEKVRTVAMGMRKRDDMLNICRTISDQLEALGIKEIRNVQTAIFYKERGVYINYEYYKRHDKTFITEVDYTTNELSKEFAAKMTKGTDEFFTRSLEGQQVKDWYNHQKTTNVFIDTYLETATTLNYYWFSLGPVAIGTSSYTPRTEEELNLFKRFRNVFGLAYQRYIDIEKAEAQAYEAKIEASLERMRAVAMSLRKSEDLISVCEAMYKELTELGFSNIRNAQIAIKHDEKQAYLISEYSDYAVNILQEAPYDSSAIVKELYNELGKSNNALYQKVFAGKDFEKWRTWRKSIKDKIDSRIDTANSMCFYLFSMGTGHVGISTFNTITNEQIEILKRFKNVFELSYRRYTDVANAEKQAREAQIQLALERVRARTMAMQKSGELSEAAVLLFHQLMSLGLDVRGCGFNIWEKDEKICTAWMSGPDGELSTPFRLPLTEDPLFIRYYESRQKGEDFWVYETGKEELAARYKYMRTLPVIGELLENDVKQGIEIPDFVVDHVVNFSNGNLIFITYKPCPQGWDIFKRFGKVFDQTYTRFLDLQKAEAQAREAKIEVALERARAQSMMMQHSTELDDTLRVFHEQVLLLGIQSAFSFLWLPDEDKDRHIFWAAWAENNSTLFKSKAINYPLDRNEPATAQCLVDWKSNEPIVSYHVPPSGVANYFAAWQELIDGVEQLKPEYFSEGLYYVEAFMKYGCFGVMVATDLKEDEKKVLGRFAIEFERTYTRFLDLQKAEAQAREAQIEMALERVRSRSMAMHKSDELKEVIRLVLEQFIHLKINAEHAGFYIDYKAHEDMHIWLADPNIEPFYAIIPYFDTPTWNSFLDAKAKGTTFHTDLLTFEEKNKFYQSLFKLFTVPEEAKKFYLQCKGLAVSTVLLDNVGLYIENFSAIPYTDEENKILMRFGKVFQQSYTRFLDLQKAEAQAREAQIQLALERVRARTMAMHESSELNETAELLFDQLKQLGAELQGVAFAICDKNSVMVQKWTSIGVFSHPYTIEPGEQRMYEAWKNQAGIYEEVYDGERIKKYFELFMEIPAFRQGIQKFIDAGHPIPTWQKNHAITFKHGYLLLITTRPFDETEIFLRFGKVFEQTYTRFLDLQKAEAQAREAKIEAALEKVRSRSLAMHKSNELSAIAKAMFVQLKELGLELEDGLIIMLFKQNSHDQLQWPVFEGIETDTMFLVPYFDHPILNEVYKARESGVRFIERHFDKAIKDDFLGKMFSLTDYRAIPEEFKNRNYAGSCYHYSFAMENYTGILVHSYDRTSYPAEHNDIIRRFARVFEQAYVRFLDLQKAEDQAREAQIEAALERVRSRTLAMQKSDELAETASELFRQMIGLGIEPNRLYITIIHEETIEGDFWITDEDGSPLAAAYTARLNENATFIKMYEGWKQRLQHLIIDMHGEELQNYFHYLQSINVPFKGGLHQKRRVTHLAYFSKGFIGLASPDEQPAETISILDRFASVFNLTFTRFNDLQVAEANALQAQQDLIEIKAARKKAEDTLTELQATQKQLVQSEKMASLGELTAGIAHEIQNPLNFVNNFSDVSNELLAEMRTELEKGNKEEAMAIVDDVKQNLEKILHHGKRADAIVKGMLQHSRSSSGQKELTDMNALCDEYLRLAYHGLRAKDKSFNSATKTDYDENIGLVKVIHQDMGRVILNLITNAFYAVNEKKKSCELSAISYEPLISIQTRKLNDKIEISVQDNGTGISQKVLDKIFQPFFTTKPTGQGTGLGLSLAYDIVKAHGGEIKVETKENEGTEFIVHLPA